MYANWQWDLENCKGAPSEFMFRVAKLARAIPGGHTKCHLENLTKTTKILAQIIVCFWFDNLSNGGQVI